MNFKNNPRKSLATVAAAALAFFVLLAASSCNIQPAGNTAALKISLAANAAAKTLQPGISLDVVSYDIYGSGPSGASFEALGIGSTIYLKEGLLPGDWTVHAVGRNAAGDAIAQSATSTVTLALAETKTVSLLCLPYAGNGSLRVDLSWPTASVVTPAIEATLTPEGGTAAPITFTITGNTASYVSGTTLTNGYYTLSLKLKDTSMSNYLVWSKVESVLLFKDQPTTANWVLTTEVVDAAPAPGVTLTLSSDTKKPVAITLFGYYTSLQQGSTMTANATGTPAPTSWQWFLDGDLLTGQTTASTTVGSGLVAGSAHTLTVIGKTADLAGSADVRFWITTSETKGVTTFAGSGAQGSADGTGTAASFMFPSGVTVDASGNVYVADTLNHKIRKISPGGVVGTLAGSGTQGSTDGTGTAASFNQPKGVAVDASGNVYVADTQNSKIRKISSSGVVTSLAGSGTQGSMDGTGTAASFNQPTGVAVDASGNVYVADTQNSKIRKISSSGVVTSLAGSGTQGSTDGTGTAASFNQPTGVAIDASGNVYVADIDNNKIRKISSSGVVTTLAGSGTSGSTDGAGMGASFSMPRGVVVDASGTVYVADFGNKKIRKISSDGVVTTLAGSGTVGSTDGAGTVASFNYPAGIAIDTSGTVYVADMSNCKIRKIVQ